jgi:putative acyl-CoA dehydrogenase
MRQALAQAVNHARGRRVFQKTLVDQPAMAAVLADLALESEAATALSLRLARTQEQSAVSESEAAYLRLMTPAVKYWVTKRGPGFAYEAMEVWGGNGYVESGIMSRLYRDIPVNAIWEGSGTVMCLDVLRVLQRSPESAEAVMADLARHKGADPSFDAWWARVAEALQNASEQTCRRLTEDLCKLAAAAIFLDSGPDAVAKAYIATRLGGGAGDCYGILPADCDTRALVDRALPPRD